MPASIAISEDGGPSSKLTMLQPLNYLDQMLTLRLIKQALQTVKQKGDVT